MKYATGNDNVNMWFIYDSSPAKTFAKLFVNHPFVYVIVVMIVVQRYYKSKSVV